jgi:hypothetical protein
MAFIEINVKEMQERHGQRSDRELLYYMASEFHYIIQKLKKMADEQLTQEQLAAQFDALSDQLDKSKQEVLTEVAALEAQIGSGSQGDGTTIIPTAAFTASLARLKSAVQAQDDLNPDAPVTTPPVETPPVTEPPVDTTPAPPVDQPAPGTSDGSTADGSTTVAPV